MIKPKHLNPGDKVAIVSLSKGMLGEAMFIHKYHLARERLESCKAVYRQMVGFEAGRPELPILYNVNVVHAYPIGVFPLGLTYEIDCDSKALRLMESATE